MYNFGLVCLVGAQVCWPFRVKTCVIELLEEIVSNIEKITARMVFTKSKFLAQKYL